jgi:hypothetical protein
MSKAAGGGDSASKGPRRRQPRRGHPVHDVFEPDDHAPSGYYNPLPGQPEASKRARKMGKRNLAEDVEQARAPQVLETLEDVLRMYGVVADLPINDSLINDVDLVRALKKALMPGPKIMNGNDQAQEAEALTKIITCEHQMSRAALVIALLKRGVRTWPPHGCQVGFTLLPPLLAALEAHGTFSEEDEWDNMFDSLAEHGENMDNEWGPLRVTATSEYYKRFKKLHWSSEPR